MANKRNQQNEAPLRDKSEQGGVAEGSWCRSETGSCLLDVRKWNCLWEDLRSRLFYEDKSIPEGMSCFLLPRFPRTCPERGGAVAMNKEGKATSLSTLAYS